MAFFDTDNSVEAAALAHQRHLSRDALETHPAAQTARGLNDAAEYRRELTAGGYWEPAPGALGERERYFVKHESGERQEIAELARQSVNQARGIRQGAATDVPVREATAAEVAKANQRRPAAEDAVAKRHGLYTADKGRTRKYFADYQQKKEVMRADPSRIRTKHDDRQTVSAVLDLAQERGWTTLRLRGTEDFRREAWVQAHVRGMQAEGYTPRETDNQELARRRAALNPAVAESAASSPKPVKAATPAAVWSDVQKAGEQARAADAAKQGQGQGINGHAATKQGKQGKRKAEEQAPAQAAQQAA